MASKPTGGFARENEKTKLWDCFIILDGKEKHVGHAGTEKGANSIVNSAIERRS